MKHTPAPWYTQRDCGFEQESFDIRFDDEKNEKCIWIASVHTQFKGLENGTANANLIVSAPELLESATNMTAIVNKCIAVLQEHILPDSKMCDREAIGCLYEILDNAGLCAELIQSKAAIAKATNSQLQTA